MPGHDGGSLIFSFTPASTIPQGGTLTLTASAAIFDASSAPQCSAVASRGAGVGLSAATGDGRALVLSCGGALQAGAAHTVTCSTHLTQNGGVGNVSFSIVSSSDSTPLMGQAGYDITPGDEVRWVGARRQPAQMPEPKCLSANGAYGAHGAHGVQGAVHGVHE